MLIGPPAPASRPSREALPADGGAFVRLLPRPCLRRRERPGGDQRRLRGAALHRGEAPGRGSADGRSTPPTCSPRPAKPLVELARAVPLPARRRSCSTCRSGSARSATASGRTATSGRTSSASQQRAAAPLAAEPQARRASGTSIVFRSPEEVEAARHRAAAALERTAATSTAPSTSSATCTAASTSSSRCCESSAGKSSAGELTAESLRRRAAALIFLGDLVDRGPRSARVLRLVHGDGRAGPRALRARQPRHEARARAARPATCSHPRAGGVAGATRARAAGVPGAGGRVPRRAGQPLRPRRRQARGRARRA